MNGKRIYEQSEFKLGELHRKLSPKVMRNFENSLLEIHKIATSIRLPDKGYNIAIGTEPEKQFFIGNLADNNGFSELFAIYPMYDDCTDHTELCRKMYGKVLITLQNKFSGIADFSETESRPDSKCRYGISMRIKPEWRPVLNTLYKRKYARYWW